MLLLLSSAFAATWSVEADGRGDFQTLTEAASMAASGDTIVVGDGTFAAATFYSRVTIKSRNGAAATTIDGGGYTSLYGPAGMDVEGLTLTSVGTNALIIVGGGSVVDSVLTGSGTAWSNYGGGAYLGDGVYSVEGSTFTGNQGYLGGGIYLGGVSSRLAVSGSSFSGNYSAYGGGIGLDYGPSLEVLDCTFETNTAYYHGGGVYAPQANAVVATGNTYTGNSAPNGWGGGVYAGTYGTYDASEEVYTGNSGQYGGGLGLYYQTVSLSGLRFEGNSASASGGGLQVYVSPGTDSGSVYDGNTSTAGYGGGAHVEYTNFEFLSPSFTGNMATADSGGGLSAVNYSVVTVTEGVFSGNEAASYGGGLFVYSGSSVSTSDSSFDSNVAYYGGGAAVVTSASLYSGNPVWTNNYANGDGGGVYAYYYSLVDEAGATYSDNTSYVNGGALYSYYGSGVNEVAASFSDSTSTYGYGAHAFLSYYGSASFESTTLSTGLAYYDGGAIYAYALYDGGLTLIDSQLDDNSSTYGSGGAAWVAYVPTLVMDTVEVTNNSAYSYGGGMSIFGGVSTQITESLFEYNSTVYYSGGALHWDSYYPQAADFSMIDSEVRYNSTDASGGGLYVSYPDLFQLSGTRVVGNIAGGDAYGGGLALMNANGGVRVDNSDLSGNSAGFGGGVYVQGTVDLDVEDDWHNNVFSSNTAAVGGAGCFVRGVRNHLTNNTLVGNAASGEGGGLCVVESDLALDNTVIAYTSAGAALHMFDSRSASGLEATYLNLYGNTAGDVGGELSVTPANLGVEPGFAGWNDDGRDNDSFVLTSTSLMRDAGNPSIIDADGSRSDIGAFGGPELVRQDLDGDGYFTDTDCDDEDATVYPGASDDWYDGIDADCGGDDDDDQDGDGSPVDEDCSDTDATVVGPCPDGEDTAVADDTATDCCKSGEDPKDDCGCTSNGGGALAVPVLLALAFARRRRS
ncbi:MAG: hypothetical protein FJ090_14120 [Deltaproteobacteria bacterium]|nr:hypothetical protein [Deltaproteobacteria bacterium]